MTAERPAQGSIRHTKPERIVNQAVGALTAVLDIQPEDARRLIEGSARLSGLSATEVSRLLVA